MQAVFRFGFCGALMNLDLDSVTRFSISNLWLIYTQPDSRFQFCSSSIYRYIYNNRYSYHIHIQRQQQKYLHKQKRPHYQKHGRFYISLIQMCTSSSVHHLQNLKSPSFLHFVCRDFGSKFVVVFIIKANTIFICDFPNVISYVII